VKFIGKESNALEDVEAGLVHTQESVYTEYCDPKRDEWVTKIQPALKENIPRCTDKRNDSFAQGLD
jgi:hypothetical protein